MLKQRSMLLTCLLVFAMLVAACSGGGAAPVADAPAPTEAAAEPTEATAEEAEATEAPAG